MTDLTRPVAGDPLALSNGKASTVILDEAFDVIEANEDAITARTSSSIITTDAYADITQVVLNAAEATTGWHAVNNDTADSDPGPSTNAIHSTGSTSVQAYLKSPSVNLTPALYVNLTEAGFGAGLTVVPGENILVDVLCSATVAETPTYNVFQKFSLYIASAVDLGGSTVIKGWEDTYTGLFLNTWYTVAIPVETLTNIKSIGIKKTGSGGSGSGRARWHLDNIRRAGVTPLDQAYHSDTEVGVIVPPDYTTANTQYPILPASMKSIIDMRPDHAFMSGIGGVKNIREWGLDETGVTDVGAELQVAFDSLEPGDVLEFPPTGIFRCDGGLLINNPHITIDARGAAFTQEFPYTTYTGAAKVATSENKRFRFESTAVGSTLRGARVYGASITPHNGSIFTPAGGAAVSGTTMLLDAISENASFANTPGRDPLGRIRYDFVLSDTTHVASDCTITVTDDDGVLLTTQTLTLTGTPTTYTVYANQRHVFIGTTAKVTKATATANVITLARMDTFNNCQTVWTFTQWEGGHGVSINASDVTVEDCLFEAVQGDGINIPNGLPTTGVQNTIVRNTMVRGCGRQGTAPCGGRGHLFENVFFLYAARHGVDLEPEFPFGNPNVSAIDGITFRNCVVWMSATVPPFSSGLAADGWARCRNVVVENLRTFAQAGGIGGGFMDSRFVDIECRVTTGTAASTINGRNITIENMRIDHQLQVGAAGEVTGIDEFGATYAPGGHVIRNVLWTRGILGIPYMTNVSPNTHLDNLRISDTVTMDQTYAVVPFQLLSDTTYTGLDMASQRAVLPNSYAPNMTQAFFPAGLDMVNRGVRRLAFLSGGTTRGNNFGRFQQAVTAGSTTLTVAFPGKTYPNVSNVQLISTTGGTMTPAQYHYRFAARNRNGGPVLALANQTITLTTGTAVRMFVDNIYDITTGIQIDGITIYRGPASGNYTTRYDLIPTGDLPLLGGSGVNNNKRPGFQDNGTTLTQPTNVASYGYGFTFPVNAQTPGPFVPIDESGYEVDTSYAVFVETSWQSTYKVSARRRDGFDLEFGVACPVGGGTVSYMIGRF